MLQSACIHHVKHAAGLLKSRYHQVMVRPSLPPLTLDALPAALAPHASLAAELPPADWDRLCRSACRAASFRRARVCCIYMRGAARRQS